MNPIIKTGGYLLYADLYANMYFTYLGINVFKNILRNVGLWQGPPSPWVIGEAGLCRTLRPGVCSLSKEHPSTPISFQFILLLASLRLKVGMEQRVAPGRKPASSERRGHLTFSEKGVHPASLGRWAHLASSGRWAYLVWLHRILWGLGDHI